MRQLSRRSELTRDEALLAIDLLARADVELVPKRALATVATVLSLDLDHAACDCLYLALAVARGDALVTANKFFL